MAIHLNTSQTRAWSRLSEIAAGSVDSDQLRESVGVPLLDLLRADTYASMVWGAVEKRFCRVVAVDMDHDRLRDWQRYYRHVDPLTMQFMRRQVPTVATQIVARRELVRSEFFGDFLRPQQMHWGINVFFFDAGECLGDLRIWRSYSRGDFDDNDIGMLGLIEPVILASLTRIRKADENQAQEGMVNAAARQPERFQDLSPRECEVARLLHRGAADKDIACVLGISYATVRFHVGHLMRKLGVRNRTAAVARLSLLANSEQLFPTHTR
ncbi:helix-turn-helix transcriptional regulator [Variovorax paradoxus]|uniref:helix-turn-helix transcriptional regulator n=1 Tax=Variovorax paradoxus TaxID=34073 RepID=UPI00102C1C82|nr:helix-turn-helix transcriptional regulator [Variovorax paradoxus]